MRGARQAFCVLDQRLSLRRKAEELASLGATDVLDASGNIAIGGGREVDDEIGLVMLTSGSSGEPKAAELDVVRASRERRAHPASLRANAPPVWFPCLRPITSAVSRCCCGRSSPTPRCFGATTGTSRAPRPRRHPRLARAHPTRATRRERLRRCSWAVRAHPSTARERRHDLGDDRDGFGRRLRRRALAGRRVRRRRRRAVRAHTHALSLLSQRGATHASSVPMDATTGSPPATAVRSSKDASACGVDWAS